MTVQAGDFRSDYIGNGTLVTYAVGFQALENIDLQVFITDPEDLDNPQEQVLDSDYTVTGDLSEGTASVVFTVPPTNLYLIAVLRNMPLSQGTNYIQYDDFPAESHERALDKLTMIAQEFKEELSRCPTMPESVGTEGLAFPAPEADRAVIWDETETKLINGPTASEITSAEGYAEASAASAVNSASSAAAAQDAKTEAESAAVLATNEADRAKSYADSLDIPLIVPGDADKMLAVNTAEDGYELRTPSEISNTLDIINSNIIDNPNFSINQYNLDAVGVTPSIDEYVIDRWAVVEALTSGPTVSLNSDRLRIEANSTENAVVYCKQLIENYADYAGKTLTLSAKVASTFPSPAVLISDGTSPASSVVVPNDGVFHEVSITLSVDAAPTSLVATLGQNPADNITTGEYFEVEWVKLEIGENATQFEPPNRAAELAKCQRFYQITEGHTNTFMLYAGRNSSDAANDGRFDFIVPMRITPALITNDLTGFRILDSGGVHISTDIAIYGVHPTPIAATMLRILSSSLTIREVCISDITPGTTLIFDANL